MALTFRRSFASVFALLVTLIVEVPTHSAARFTAEDHTKASLEYSGGFAVDMMQYHHVKSPYAKPNLTLEQRVEIAVKSSLSRGQYFHNLISGEASNTGNQTVLPSPVESFQGFYVTQISLGTPARTFVVIIDTGSELAWVQCASCQTCYTQVSPIFDPTASSTYQILLCIDAICPFLEGAELEPPYCSIAGTCIYTYQYGRGKTAGDLAYETVTLNTTSGTSRAFPEFTFGCSHDSTDFFNGADGVVGLGQGPLSLVAQLGPEIGNLFSYCLVDFYSGINTMSQLLLGSPGPVPLQYTPLITNVKWLLSTHYYINLVNITVNGVAVQYPAEAFQISSNGSGGLILDSGTSLSLLDSRAYTPFVSLLQSVITYPPVNFSASGFDLCYNISGLTNATFPTVVFQLEDVDVVLPPENVFIPVDEVGDICLAFWNSPYVFSIFGNVQQQNFQIPYDRANQRVEKMFRIVRDHDHEIVC